MQPSSIPDNATMIEEIKGTINLPGGETHGQAVTVQRYRKMCGYANRETHWLLVKMPWRKAGHRTYCKQFSGRNIADLNRQFAEFRESITEG